MVNVVDDDYGDASMQCTYHPYKNNSPSGGICAFCLQEKLGKLVSSPFLVTTKATASSSSTSHHSSSVLPVNANNNPYHHFKKSRNPFLPIPKNKHQNHPPSSSSNAVTFNRSKSTVMRGTNLVESSPVDDLGTTQKRGFWSFTHLSKLHKIKQLASIAKIRSEEGFPVEENGSAVDRKVSRSRSVGGGNWSISGDILGKLSTRFGECALRRVESQREGNPRLGLGLSDSDKDF